MKEHEKNPSAERLLTDFLFLPMILQRMKLVLILASGTG